MKTEFGGKVGDWILDRGTGSHFPVRVLASEIFLKILENLFEFPQKILVLCELFKAGLPRKLQHAHRIMIGLVPKLEVEFPKQSAGRWFPCPPEIETQFPQRLERCRQDRGDVVSLKSRHVF